MSVYCFTFSRLDLFCSAVAGGEERKPTVIANKINLRMIKTFLFNKIMHYFSYMGLAAHDAFQVNLSTSVRLYQQ